jgi:O-acetylhomoserine (thiol)-lyase
MSKHQNWSIDTKVVHTDTGQKRDQGSTTVPIYQTASFAYDTAEELEKVFHGRQFGYLYSRISNPTLFDYERTVNDLEEGLGAVVTSSGMSAIATVFYALTQAGDEIVVSQSLFGGTYYLLTEIFEKYGVTVKYVPATDVAAYAAAITDKTRLIFLETLGNPKLDVPDFEAIAAVAKKKNIPLVIDSTLTSPVLLNGKSVGADVVVHSATKYLSGSGSTIGGVLVDTGRFDWKTCRTPRVAESAKKFGPYGFLAYCRRKIVQNTGSSISPFNVYLLSLGVETLALRMQRHCDNAQALAQALQTHPQVVSVNYPGLPDHPSHGTAKRYFGNRFGGLVTIRLGSKDHAYQLINHLKLAKNLANVGDSRTLVIHPASTIYQDVSVEGQAAAGVFQDLIRISVGIENPQDIIADFMSALKEVAV